MSSQRPSPVSWQRNLAFIWVGVFVGLLGANFVFPFIPFFIKDLGVTGEGKVAFYTGVTASATGLSLTLTAPIWGALADRYGRKMMLMRALIGAGLTILAMGAAQAVWQLVALRFCMGAFAGSMGAAAALVAATTPRARVGQALGILQTGVFAANMLGPFIGGVVAASLGIRESFVFCAVLYIIAGVLVFTLVEETGSADPLPAGAPEPGAGTEKHDGLVESLRVVLAERQIVFMLGLLFVLWLSTTFVRPVMPLSIDNFAAASIGGGEDEVHLAILGVDWVFREEAATGTLFGVLGLTSTIAAIVVAPAGQRLGYRNTVTGAALLTGLLYMPVALAGSYTWFVLFFAAVGLFQGAMVPGTNALIAAAVPEGKQGSAFGLASSMQSMALLLGPVGGGAVAATAGLGGVYVSIGLLLMAAAVGGALVIVEPTFGREDSEPVREPASAGR